MGGLKTAWLPSQHLPVDSKRPKCNILLQQVRQIVDGGVLDDHELIRVYKSHPLVLMTIPAEHTLMRPNLYQLLLTVHAQQAPCKCT